MTTDEQLKLRLLATLVAVAVLINMIAATPVTTHSPHQIGEASSCLVCGNGCTNAPSKLLLTG